MVQFFVERREGKHLRATCQMAKTNGGHRNRELHTFAFLDTGSAVSLIKQEVQQILNVPGRLRPIEMVQNNGNVQKEQGSRGIEIELRTLEGHSCHINEIRTVRKLDLPTRSVDARELCKKYQYLNSVNIPSYVQGSPTTLLGLPHAHLLYAMTYRVGMPGEPVAVKTPLGWTIFGGSWS